MTTTKISKRRKIWKTPKKWKNKLHEWQGEQKKKSILIDDKVKVFGSQFDWSKTDFTIPIFEIIMDVYCETYKIETQGRNDPT